MRYYHKVRLFVHFVVVNLKIALSAVKDDRVSYYSLRKLYLHDLGIDGRHFTAYNMTFGAFGGVRGKDMIIVQSMDGKLQIFEQSAHAFSRQLADCLIPGPLAYLPKLDAFITVNYAGIAECYRYQVLASSAGEIGLSSSASEAKSDHRIKAVKSNVVEWATNLGESCRQIIVGNFSSIESVAESVNYRNSSNHANELLMVCDKSLFLIKAETGGIIQQRKLDRSDASCVCVVPYIAELPNSNTAIAHNFLLAYQDATVQVFSGFQLIWAARLSSVPVHLTVATFAGQKGLIAAIDENGYLSVNFLGTKPAIQPILSQVRDLDYDKIDEEHRSLLQIIRDSQNDTKIDQVDKLLIKSQLTRTFDLENNNQYYFSTMGAATGEVLPAINQMVSIYPSAGATATHGSTAAEAMIKATIRLYLTYTNERPATNVTLTLSTSNNLFISPKNIHLPKVTGLKTTPLVVKVSVFATKSLLTTSLDLNVTAAYTSHKNEPQITSHIIHLPAFLACRPRPPSKNALYKLTLDTDFNAIPLTDLFADVLYAYQEAGLDIVELLGNNSIQAMGFQHFNSAIVNTSVADSSQSNNSSLNPTLVSILVSKNAGRYRVQSDSYSLMYSILAELERRLNQKIESSSPSESQTSLVKFNDALPFEEYFILIQSHLSYRIELLQATSRLNDVSQQYRLIEKRLLVRFKDKNPTPLNGLDILLKETYQNLLQIGKRSSLSASPSVLIHSLVADEVETIQTKIAQYSNEIECFSKLMTLLISLKYQFSLSERQFLQSFLCPEIKDGIEQVA